MRRLIPLTLALSTGCATTSMGGPTNVRAQFDPRLDFPVTRVAQANSEPAGAAEAGAGPGERHDDEDDTDARLDRVSPAVFWTGMVVGLVGSAAAIGFMVDGAVIERKVETGYEEGFTRADRDRLETRGDLDNSLAGAGAGLAVGGLSLALIMAGIDYSRCGPVTRRRKCERRAHK